MKGGQRVVLGALGAMVVLATIRQVSTKPGLPPPGIYIGAGVWFSALFLLGSFASGAAGAVAVGTVFSALLAPYVAGGSGNSPLTQLAGLISSISGGNPPSSSSSSSGAQFVSASVSGDRSSGAQMIQ